jgi:Fe-S cluster assembly protein SufD
MNLQELSANKDSGSRELQSYREKELNLFKEQGLSLNPEDYKFTNLPKFFEDLPKTEVASGETVISPDSDLMTFRFLDGVFQTPHKIEGVIITPVSDKFEEVKELLVSQNALNHLHHGLLDHGLFLEVQKNCKVTGPIRIQHIITKNTIKAPTLIIKMKAHSEMSLMEEFSGTHSSYAEVSESYIHLEAGAKLEHLQLNHGKNESLHHGSTWTKVQKDASYTNLIFHLSGKLSRRNLDIKLLEPGSHGESFNLFLTSDKEHSDINTVINHEAPDTTSNQIAKGILGGESKAIFTGKIFIHPKAQRVSSGQINRNLLLSPKAQVHSQPQLEIFADDVKCSHGSTTGQLSPDEIFYFESRGLPAEKARTLLAHGFGLEIVLKIKDQKLRSYLEKQVLEALKNKFKLGGTL